MATVEIAQRWIDELQHLSNGKELDISTEIEAARLQTDWSAGFFEQTAGAWQGDPLQRSDQGKFEDRITLK